MENKINKKLSYEDWCQKYMADVDPAMIEELKNFHGVDAVKEVEDMRRREYEFYITGGFEK